MSHRIGVEQDSNDSVELNPVLSSGNYNEDLWEKTEYGAPTGEWFFHKGEGIIGYSFSSGIEKAGGMIYFDFNSLEENGDSIKRDVRIQLTSRDGYEKKEVISEEIIHVDTAARYERIYSEFLPEAENVSYILSVEILNEDGEVEDTILSYLYVSVQEMNAKLWTDQSVYDKSSDVTLILENEGPTVLFFGKAYSFEKSLRIPGGEFHWR